MSVVIAMPITNHVKIKQKKDCLTIYISGRFDFQIYPSFKNSFKLLDSGTIRHCFVDLREMTYIHSSGIGMLILLKEKALASGVQEISIVGVSLEVHQILKIFHVDHEFKIIHL